MKKFLALAFVCAGLTAMAVTPRVNNVNIADLTKKAGNGSMVMKSNTLAKSLTAGVMNVQAGKSQMSPKQFFSSRNLGAIFARSAARCWRSSFDERRGASADDADADLVGSAAIAAPAGSCAFFSM